VDTPTLVREAIRASGQSRAELARRAGIAQSVLSAYEHGRRDPTVASLNRVLAAAGLELGTRRQVADGAPAEIRSVDAVAANRELQDVLSFVDALPFQPKPAPLAYPVFARR
jgi:transcriptional regulator with XRE-family HTH domain